METTLNNDVLQLRLAALNDAVHGTKYLPAILAGRIQAAQNALAGMGVDLPDPANPPIDVILPAPDKRPPRQSYTFYFVEKPGLNSKEVIDGDTISAVVDIGLDFMVPLKIRLVGVDAPEIHDPVQYKAASVSKRVLAKWLAKQKAGYLVIESQGWDKYAGRIDADVVVLDSTSTTIERCSEFLLKFGCVRAYKGEAKPPWTEQELLKIESLADAANNL